MFVSRGIMTHFQGNLKPLRLVLLFYDRNVCVRSNGGLLMSVRITHKKQLVEPGEQMGFLALILHLKDKTAALWFHSAVRH